MYLSDSGNKVSVKGSVTVSGNKGGDTWLCPGKKITVAGPLNGSTIKVLLTKIEGVFTTGYSTYNSGIAPSTYFASGYGDGYEVYLNNNEAAVRAAFAPGDDDGSFVKRPDQITDDTSTLLGANWMHGISGDRYLNEFNIPYTHDSAMKEAYAWVGSSIGAHLGFHSSAQTQYLFIDEQLDAGVRILDLRLSNFYNDHSFWDEVAYYTSWLCPVTPGDLLLGPGATVAFSMGAATHCMSDDGSNLWLCHGKEAIGGTFWAEDHDGDQLNLKKVLRWAEEFLRLHPSETIVMDFAAETPGDKDEYKKIVYDRLRQHLKDVYGTVNPSTGRSYIYQEAGSDSPFVEPSHMPQLKDCRGQIVIMKGGGDVHGISLTTGGLRKISDGTSNDVDGHTKVDQLAKFFESFNYELPTDANTHPGIICQPDTNSKADSLSDILNPHMRPLYIASIVHPTLFDEGGVFNNDRTAGRYFGWVKLDGAVYSEVQKIYESNFFDGLEYVTLTVKPSANADDSDAQTYRLLKNTDLTIPECIYDDPDPNKGSFINWMSVDAKGNMTAYDPGDTVEVGDDMTFIAQWDNDKTAQAKVYEVFQDADGFWEEPTEGIGTAFISYTPAKYNHYTVSGYSTSFAADESDRTAVKDGATINIEEGKTKLYVYFTRNSYDLVYYEDMAGTKVAKTVKVPYEANLDDYADEFLTKDGCIFAGWTTSPKADGELYYYEETIPDSWKDADVAQEYPCVLYRFRDTMPGIMAHRLNETHDVQILTTGGTSVRVQASALSYAQAVFTSEEYKDNMDAQLLATALWRYWKAADAFMKVHAS